MRLLHTTDLYFKEFLDKPYNEYAILSHRWGDDEATFQDFQRCRASKDNGQGVLKVLDFCKIAKEHGYEWAWCDTCCIDVRSNHRILLRHVLIRVCRNILEV